MSSYDQLANSLMTKYQIPGAAIAVVHDGKLVFARGYGHAETGSGQLVQPDSMFRIASLSKPVTSAAILLLVQRGKLSLDQRVFDILPHQDPLPGGTVDPRLSTITVRELLEHAGGWNRDTTFDPAFLPVVISAAAGTPSPASSATIIHYMMGKPLQFSPGTDYNYSNYGYILLGRVVETINGLPYETFVREQVLSPSGAACMRIGHSLQSQALPKEVKYYDYPGAPLFNSIYGTGAKVPGPDGGICIESLDSAGGWVASPVDYLRFVLSIDGRTDHPDLLSASTIATMTARPSVPNWASTPTYDALGWKVRPIGNDATWWHLGALSGTATEVVRGFNGVTTVVFFNSRPSDSTTFENDLDSGISSAAASVTTWPATDQFSSFEGCVAGPRQRAAKH